MVVRLLGAGALLAAAASAQGAFDGVSVDLGGAQAGTNGTPVVPSAGGSFIQFAAGGNTNTPTTHAAFAPVFGTQGAGTAVIGIQTLTPTHVPGTNGVFPGAEAANGLVTQLPAGGASNVLPGSVEGFWAVQVAVASGVSPGGFDAIWIGRIRTTPGASLDLSNADARVGIFEGATQAVVQATAAGTNNDTDASPDPLAFMYRIASYQVPNQFSDGSGTYDLYIEQFIPTPGAVAIFGMAGLATIRRRRG